MSLLDMFNGGKSRSVADACTTTGTTPPTGAGLLYPLGDTDTTALQKYYSRMQAQQNQMLGTIAAPNMIGQYTSTRGRDITTIEIEETSNGSIIRVGGVTRVCPTDGVLMDQIGAAYTEAKLK